MPKKHFMSTEQRFVQCLATSLSTRRNLRHDASDINERKVESHISDGVRRVEVQWWRWKCILDALSVAMSIDTT